jgi:hypothetical protein
MTFEKKYNDQNKGDLSLKQWIYPNSSESKRANISSSRAVQQSKRRPQVVARIQPKEIVKHG